MLDVKGAAPVGETSKAEAPRPKPNLELPSIDPEVNYLGIISIVATIIIIVAGVALYVLNGTKSSELATKEAEAQSLETNLGTEPLKSSYEEILSTQKGLDQFSDIMSNQIKWSGMFKEYEKIIPKNVKITALTMDEKMTIKLNGEAGDFIGIAKFIQSLENSNYFQDIRLISSSISEVEESSAVNFALSYLVNEKELAKASESTTVVEPANSLPNQPQPTGQSQTTPTEPIQSETTLSLP